MHISNLMKSLLTKAAILAADDLTTIDVDVPEWGGAVRIKSMTGAERDGFEDSLFVDVSDGKGGTKRVQNLKHLRAKLVAASLVDEDGTPVFTMDEVASLAKKSAAALNRCFEAAQKLNGMGQPAEVEAKNDSPSAPSAASTSDSPAT